MNNNKNNISNNDQSQTSSTKLKKIGYYQKNNHKLN